MGKAITAIADPALAGSSTDPDQWQAGDNKQHEREMNDKDDIGKQQFHVPLSGSKIRCCLWPPAACGR